MESDSPLRTRRGKRTAFEDLKGATPKKGRVVLSDSSGSESEHSLERVQREKPLAETLVLETYSFSYRFNLPLSCNFLYAF